MEATLILTEGKNAKLYTMKLIRKGTGNAVAQGHVSAESGQTLVKNGATTSANLVTWTVAAKPPSSPPYGATPAGSKIQSRAAKTEAAEMIGGIGVAAISGSGCRLL